MPEEILQPVTPVEQTGEVVPPQGETVPQEQTQEGTTEQTATAEDENIIRNVVDGEEVVYDLRNPEDVARLKEDASKGLHFTRKSQAVAEWEQGQRSNVDLVQNMFGNNPRLFDMAVAQQNGFNPALVGVQLQPPDPALAEHNPQLYYQQLAQYEYARREQEAITRLTQATRDNFTRQNNEAVFNKARVVNELGEGEIQAVRTFMESRMRPNAMGMWTDEDVQYAISAVVGKERSKQSQLNTVKQINRSVRESMKPNPQNVPQRRSGADKSAKEREQDRMFELAKERRSGRV